jgi:hypothetical protein
MGTSRNDPSPNIPEWRPAIAALGNKQVPPERQGEEIWRAVLGERPERLLDDFGHAIVALGTAIAARHEPVGDALTTFDQALCAQYDARLSFDMARRALARTAAQRGGAEGYARELFAEATGYYASRDLPSALGQPGRIGTSSELIGLKTEIADGVRDRVRRAGAPPTETDAWKVYVRRVVTLLGGGEQT